MEPRTTDPESAPSGRRGGTRTARDRPAYGHRLAPLVFDDVPAALRELVGQGFTSTEAANLAAYLFGLARTDDGWTMDEIERLVFVRHLASRRRIRS